MILRAAADTDLLEERGFVRRSAEIGSRYRPDEGPITYGATSLATYWARFAWDEDEGGSATATSSW